jgi:hypothetical protein
MRPTAWMVIVHQEPRALLGLLDRLQAPWAHSFVHVDAKAERHAFEVLLRGRSDCTILSPRDSTKVYWGAWSLTDATLRLLRAAYSSERNFERFSVLSGIDMPIKSLAQIAERLDTDTEIIRVDRVLDPVGDGMFDRRANRVFLGGFRFTNPRSETPVVPRLARKVEAKLPNRPYPDLPIYYGAPFWCITRTAVKEIFRFVQARRDVIRWFKRTSCSDEMLLQTILKQSPVAERIAYDLTRGDEDPGPTVHGSHFIDWSRPNPHSPRTLLLEDLPLLKKSQALFARKFEAEGRSRTLVEAIDKELLDYRPRA